MRRSVIVLQALLLACGGSAPSAEAPAAAEAPAETGGDAPRDEASAASPPEATPETPAPSHGVLSDDDLRRGLFARLRDPRFPSCTVGRLSPAQRRRTSAAQSALASRVTMELPADAVSAGRAEDRDVAVYLSTRLDARSPAGDHGYRVRIRDAAGAVEDLALGISFRRPYVLVDNPRVAILREGGVELEAEMRELDDASVIFPLSPGSTRTLREGREMLVRCDLDDLRRDQDGDGLTDLEEERLGTDAWDADTDGDGTPDASDHAPLAAEAASTPSDEVWLAAYRAIVRPAAGDGVVLAVRPQGARLHVEGDAGRVLVLREDELSALAARFGRRPFVVISVTMQGDDRARVEILDTGRSTTHTAQRTGATWRVE